MTDLAIESTITGINEIPTVNVFSSYASRWWNRFMILEVILYFIPSSFYAFPSLITLFANDFFNIFFWPWTQLAKIIYGPHANFDVKGANDDSSGYFFLFAILIFSAIVALLWALLERRTLHPKLDTSIVYIWKNGLRLSLAVLMIYYGMMKTIPDQMHPPYPTELSMSIGEQDGYGYLWNFMGYSPLFVILVGIAELLGGILLLIPRFFTLGGYLSLIVMIPVALMNFCYDIPVKVISTQMCIEEIILLWPSLKEFFRYFIYDKTLTPHVRSRIINFSRTWQRRTCVILYRTFWVIFIFNILLDNIEVYDSEKLNQKIPLNGRWIVTQITDLSPRWDALWPKHWNTINISVTNNNNVFFKAEFDPRLADSLGQNYFSTFATYNKHYLQLPTNIAAIPSLNVQYHIIKNSLILTSINPKTHQSDLIISAIKAAPWPYHSGEFHWISNPVQFFSDVLDTHSQFW